MPGIQQLPEGEPGILEPCLEKLDLEKLKKDASKYPQAGVPPEKMGFWNNLDQYFKGLQKTDNGAQPWALLSLKEKKISQPIQSDNIAIPESIGNALNKETAPLPAVGSYNYTVHLCI